MTAAELKQANLDHFKRLLEHTADPRERLRIEELIAEERLKPVSAYPISESRPPR
jgi:hypothetical protein